MKLKDFMFMNKNFFISTLSTQRKGCEGIILIFLIYFFIFSDQVMQTFFFNDPFNCYLLFCPNPLIMPLKEFSNLSDKNISRLLKKELGNKGGVYSILNTESHFQYIGSSINLHSRLMDHIKGRDSNLRLQRAINKIGLFKIISSLL